MKTIKIFLASSITEFRNERYELTAFINSLNNICIRKDIYLEMKICEELSSALAVDRKQNEYNKEIQNCDYVLMLFGKNAGIYTIEEFDVAFEQLQATGKPKIMIYFKQLPEGESADQSVLDFMERLDSQPGHYYSTFMNINEVKHHLMLALFQDAELNILMEIQNGQVLLDKQPVLSLEKQ